MPEKTPQDHKTKGDKFTFTVAGKSYVLPRPDEKSVSEIPGGLTMDAVMYPDDQAVQLRLGFATLEAAKPSDAAMAAFRSLGTNDMLEVLGNWMGESSGSSD